MLFSFSTPLNKLLLEQSSVLTLTTVRMFLAGFFIIFSWLSINKRRITFIKREHVVLFINKLFFGSYLKYVLKYWGLQYVSPLHATFLFFTTPLWAALYDYVYFNQRFTVKQVWGLIVILLAVVPLVFSQQHSFFAAEGVVLLPSLALLCAVGAHCYGVICTKSLIINYQYDPILISAYSNIGTGFLGLVTGLCFKESFVIVNGYTFMPYLIILVFISNILGKIWHTYLLKKHPMVILSLAEYFNPIFVAIYSWFFWEISISSEQIIFGVGLMCGLYLFHDKKVTTSPHLFIPKNVVQT